MPNFEYTGQLPSGAAVTGEVEAGGPDQARKELEGVAIHVTAVAATPAIRLSRPLSREDVLFFNEQLASLAQTGVALDQGLRILAKDLSRGRLRRVVEHLADELQRGVPLEQAVSANKVAFPPLYADVLRAGARNNQLGTTLVNLGTHLKLMDAGRRLFWESAIYPLIVLVLGFCILSFFMWRVVPGFESLYTEFRDPTADWGINRSEVDFATYGVVQTTSAVMFAIARHWTPIAGTIITIVLIGMLVFWLMGLSPSARSLRDGMVAWIPGIGSVQRMSLLARFAQAAALGAQAGQDLPTLLRLASGATGNELLIRDADRLARRVETGANAVDASLESRVIPSIFGYTAQVAGSRGHLAAALAEMARVYDELARYRLSMFRAVLVPFLIVFTAMIIGSGLIALLSPLFQMINNMTGG